MVCSNPVTARVLWTWRRHTHFAGDKRLSPRKFVLTLLAVTLCGISWVAFFDQFSKSPTCYRAYACVGLSQSPAHALGLDEFVLGGVRERVAGSTQSYWHDLRFF